MPVPGTTPDHEIDWPSAGSGYTTLNFTGGVTLTATTGTFTVASDGIGNYITPDSDEVVLQRGNVSEPPASDFAMRVQATAPLDTSSTSLNTSFVTVDAGQSTLNRRATMDLPFVTKQWSYGSIANGSSETWGSGGDFLTHWLTADRYGMEWAVEDLQSGTGSGHTETEDAPDWLYCWKPTTIRLFRDGPQSLPRLYDVSIWYTPSGYGLWNTRQRATATGNAGGHTLRQRGNGGANGSWPLRQRQTGL